MYVANITLTQATSAADIFQAFVDLNIGPVPNSKNYAIIFPDGNGLELTIDGELVNPIEGRLATWNGSFETFSYSDTADVQFIWLTSIEEYNSFVSGFKRIVNDTRIVYYNNTVSQGVEIDTGIDPFNPDDYVYNDNQEMIFTVRFFRPQDGIIYGLEQTLVLKLLSQDQNETRFARGSDFGTAGGDANWEMWYDDAASTIHFLTDTDGQNYQVFDASITIREQRIGI